jgi:hypothetical protein
MRALQRLPPHLDTDGSLVVGGAQRSRERQTTSRRRIQRAVYRGVSPESREAVPPQRAMRHGSSWHRDLRLTLRKSRRSFGVLDTWPCGEPLSRSSASSTTRRSGGGASRRMPDLAEAVVTASASTSILLTNLGLADLRALAPRLPREARLLGFRREVGFWMLLGAAAAAAPEQWRSPNSTPLGMPATAPELVQAAGRPRHPDAMDESPTRRKRHWCTLAVGRGLLARGSGSCEANSEICGCTSACVGDVVDVRPSCGVGGPSPTELNQKMRRNDKEGDGGMTQSSQPVWVLQ